MNERQKKREKIRADLQNLHKSQSSKQKDKNADMNVIAGEAQDMEREMERDLVEEEKSERARIKREVEEIKRLQLLEYEQRLKRGEGKGNFEGLLDEYTKKRKEVETDVLEEQRLLEQNLKKRLDEKRAKKKMGINEEKRKNELELEKKSGGAFVSLRKQILQKVGVLENEAGLGPNPVFEEERSRRGFKDQLSKLRESNQYNIDRIKELNEDELDNLREQLHQDYISRAGQIHAEIPEIDATEIISAREDLEHTRQQMSVADPAERQHLEVQEAKLMKKIRILLGNEEDKNSKFIRTAMEQKSKIRTEHREIKAQRRQQLY